MHGVSVTQGVALGYVQAGLSARPPLMGIHGSGYINPGVHRDRQMPANGLKAIPKALHKYTVEAEQAMSATAIGGGRPESPKVGIAGLARSWQFGHASVHIVPANGLKAQKPLAQGKRSDTLGNARPSRACALKGQKHNHRQPVRQPRRITTTHTYI